MSKITDILGYIADLKTIDGTVFTGYFSKPGNNIWFVGRVKTEDFRKMNGFNVDTICLAGNVNEISVYIEKACIAKKSCAGVDPEYVSVDILPYEIAVGISKEEIPIVTNRIEFEMPELNWFFNESVVVLEHDVSSANFPAKLNRFECHACYSGKKISITRMFNCTENKDALSFGNVNRIEIEFDKPENIMEALHEVAKIQQLIGFFADDYIELPHEIDFSSPTSQAIGEGTNRAADKNLWLNDNFTYSPGKKKYPFRLQYNVINDYFEDILKKWIEFRSSPLNLPIIELFSEIIASKSVGLNRFLNLCQAIEVYSTQFRNAEAEKVREADKQKPENNKNKNFPQMPTLFHRLIEIFKYHSDIFPRTDNEIEMISKEIADIRNYYTHYNPDKHRRLKERYGEVESVYSKFEGQLHFILLATVYKEIGIDSKVIHMTLTGSDFRFGVYTEQLFEGPDKN